MKKKIATFNKKPADHTKMGLEREGQFPLYNEEYVRKALEFFEYCPRNRQLALAVSINEQARNLDMELAVSAVHPYYRYANKELLNKDAIDIQPPHPILQDSTIERFSEKSPGLRETLYNIRDRKLSTIEDIADLEVFIAECPELAGRDILLRTPEGTPMNVFFIINTMMKKKYELFYSKLKFVDNAPITETRIRANTLLVNIIDDIFSLVITNMDLGNENILFYKEKLDTAKEMITVLNSNKFLFNRYLRQTKEYVKISQYKGKVSSCFVNKVIKCCDHCMLTVEDKMKGISLDGNATPSIFGALSVPYQNTSEYLEKVNSLIRSEIKADIMGFPDPMYNNTEETIFQLKDIVGREHSAIVNNLANWDGAFRSKNIKHYRDDYTLRLDAQDLIAIQEKLKGDYYDRLYVGTCYSGNMIYFGVKSDQLYLFGKGSDSLIAVMLYDSRFSRYSESACKNFIGESPMGTLKIFNIYLTPKPIQMSKLTEGIELDGDGNVKFTFNKNTSFMDEYDKAHKQLDMNWKTKNYEGMKENLAFLFTLIINIERDYIHTTKRVDATKKNDAIKARMFAINDFKTYLRKIRSMDPAFDFTKYYEGKGYDKITFTVKSETIVGVKKLFNLVMMA